MSVIDPNNTVGAIVREHPALARVLEEKQIDYCCGGKKPLRQACEERGLDVEAVVTDLESALQSGNDEGEGLDVRGMSLTELCDHIEAVHHEYLRSTLPRLDAITEKVSRVHGDREPRLHELRKVFLELKAELEPHMWKEEHILFPAIRGLERGEPFVGCPTGSVEGPVRQMEFEHDHAGDALARMRELTDGFQPPEWACNTYRVMLHSLAELERDMHAHVHKENNVLFPRALELEQSTSV